MLVMEMQKRSIIWRLPSNEFRELVASCDTYAEVLRHFGMLHKGGNHNTLKRRIQHEGIDASHLEEGGARRSREALGRSSKGLRLSDEDVFREGSTYCRYNLKRRILEQGLIPYVCGVCGMGPEWNGKPISLPLDHINGVSDDHRLENLRFLCPNCHAQTETFGRRKRGGVAG